MKFTIYQESRPGKRPNNEDRLAHCYSRDALLTVVADGMGGHYYGEIAAQIAVQTLIEGFQREANPTIADPFLFLQKSILNGHHAISDFSAKHRLGDSPRTTSPRAAVSASARTSPSSASRRRQWPVTTRSAHAIPVRTCVVRGAASA